ncbi:MAG: RnfABCDGE type electron transport complex subunit B [Clostridia bacterium]|nr:RnfABCDGE type electron transport complex subunit B [Clostridia bacterium]
MNITNIILAVVIVGVTGLVFGCLLAFASVIFAVKKDERETKILEILPGANCGACGYAGCSAYAAAIVNDNAPVNSCSVGKDAAAQKIGKIMGVKAESIEPMTATVMCGGDCSTAVKKYEYEGIHDCLAASKLAGGPKACPNGCLGFGNCAIACPFDAISIESGIAVIDENKCQACGLCIKKCPKHIIKLVPKKNKYWVLCSNSEKGALTNKYCSAGCIGCRMCEKVCPVGAIKVTDNFAEIDYSICINCGECANKCPKKAIVKRGA